MQALAASEQPSAPKAQNAPVQPTERPLSRKVRQALDLLAAGKAATQKAAAEAVGIVPETLSRALQKSAAQVFMTQRARQTIAIASMRASERVVELIDASSEHVSLDAAKHVLAIGNIRPPDAAQANVNVNVSVGYVIDLTPAQHAPDMRTVNAVIDQGAE